MTDDPDLTPDVFRGMQLTPEDQAKVDVFRDNWKRDGDKAVRIFIETETSLALRGIEQVVGSEAVREALRDRMNEIGMTRADLDRMKKRRAH